jgi:FkbM family methyltransferase
MEIAVAFKFISNCFRRSAIPSDRAAEPTAAIPVQDNSYPSEAYWPFSRLSDADLVSAAYRSAPTPRDATVHYPHWRYCIEEQNLDRSLLERFAIWSEFKRRGLTTPIEIFWLRGIKLNVTMGNDLSRCTYVCGSFEPNEFAFMARYLKFGMNAVDIGANEGTYSLFMAKLVGFSGRVLAFEPSTREFARLSENVKLNGFTHLKVFPIGLSDANCFASLRIAEAEHAGLNTLGVFLHVTEELGVEPISLRQLDSVCAEEGLERLDFLKIDVEGAELKVLRGGRETIKRFTPVIQIEMFEGALRAQNTTGLEVLGLLQDLGYRFYEFCDETGEPRAFAPAPVANNNLLAVPARIPALP